MVTITQKKIDLAKFRGNQSSLFTGRPQGMLAREDLKLDELDKKEDVEVIFEIPEGTTSFNPSFYLGLLYPSYKKLGADLFPQKYRFKIKSTDEETIKVLQENLQDGIRNAVNELNRKTGLWLFINHKKP